VHGKGSKQREVYFTTECKVWLKRYLDRPCKAFFVTESLPVRRMAIPTIRYAVKKLAARGEVTVNVYPHRFRHTYACHLLDNGVYNDFYILIYCHWETGGVNEGGRQQKNDSNLQ
jgi:integrase/recombinase XerD